MSRLLKMICLIDDYIKSALTYPLTITGKIKRYLHNYTIFGNTTNGKSVGDLVTEGEYEGKYKVPVIARGKNLWDKDATDIYRSYCSYSRDGDKITAKGDEGAESLNTSGQIRINLNYVLPALHTYTISFYATRLEDGIYPPQAVVYYGTSPSYATYSKRFRDIPLNQRFLFSHTITSNVGLEAITFRLNSHKWLIELDTIQIEEGTAPTDHEPYIKPVTTDIYLDKPIASGESINYRADKLPPLLQFKGTTIYETETLVKPDGIQTEYY